MGRVPEVDPPIQGAVLGDALGHHHEPSARAEKGVQHFEALPWRMKMLDRLGTGHEVVGLLQRLLVGKEEGVIVPARVARLDHQAREGGAGSTSNVDSFRARRELSPKRFGRLSQEGAVARVGGIVFVGLIPRALVPGGEMVRGIHEEEAASAGRDALVQLAPVEVRVGFAWAEAEGARHGWLDTVGWSGRGG
jgi:hypothetical protein